MYTKWIDERMANQTCDGIVAYDQLGVLWKPTFYVYDILEKVITVRVLRKILLSCQTPHWFKGFFLDNPDESNSGLLFDTKANKFQYFGFMMAKIRCPMDFVLYPFDTQICQFKFGSAHRTLKEEV